MALPLSYHWRNLFVRKATTALTVLVIAAVVGTFAWVIGFVAALNRALSVASDPRKIIVLQRGGTSETNSAISPEEFNRLTQLTDVERDPDTGRELISPEMFWQTQLPRVRDGGATRANVAVRGVTEMAFLVHRNVRPQGATISTGLPEVIVGLSAAKQFSGLNIGDTLRLGFAENREFKVVGYFSADGGPMESEIWAYLPLLQSAYGRTGYSAASLRLREGADPAATIAQMAGAAIQLSGQTEGDYWRSQSSMVRIYQGVCYVLIGMMTLAAMFSIANTMFATVAGRTREIAMLRTIGFSGGQVLRGFMLESTLLALLGGALGCAACWAWLQFVGHTKDMFGTSTFTAMAFDIRMTPVIVLISLAMVAVVGVLGAVFPARRAAQTQVIRALREE
ncbi:MAG: hypothetical protein CHACPFDD_02851 [Phycisphaerae bacterium]|nr:hypothetical protein [Phycisphaerae bacterium]